MRAFQKSTRERFRSLPLFKDCDVKRFGGIGIRNYLLTISLLVWMLAVACTLSQKLSENYSLMNGVKANDPVIVDGSLETIGHSQTKLSSGSLSLDTKLTSEAIVYLPEKKRIFQVKIHSSNLQDFQLMALNTMGEWNQIHEERSTKSKVIDIRLKQPVTTNGIKLVVRKTSDDAAQKRRNLRVERENEVTPGGKVRRGRFVYKVSGPLKATAKIAEIELYGYVEKTP